MVTDTIYVKSTKYFLLTSITKRLSAPYHDRGR